jgi:glycosyltransferase involved in cell wall biosynthesis
MTPPMTRDLNVLMYTPTPNGGHALYTQELLTALAEVGPNRGVSAELVTSVDLAPENQTTCYPIHRILPRLVPRNEYPNRFAWATSRVVYYTRRERAFLGWVAGRPDVDVIHFQEYTPWMAPRHCRELRRRGISLVFTVHNIYLHFYHNYVHNVVRDSALRTAWRECDALLVHSEGLRDALGEFLGPGHPPIHVTAHGVWRAYAAATAPPETAPGRHRLLFFGGIRPNKGLHVLLRAMDRLPQHDLTVAGEAEEDSYHEQIVRLARGLPADRIELIDRYVAEEEVPGFFDRSRLVVLPYTKFASQSGVLHQALAHWRPVVATDVGALGECVRQWGIGTVVPPDNEHALADGIAHALEPANYRAAVDAIGRVRDELTWTRMADATIDVYRSIVA